MANLDMQRLNTTLEKFQGVTFERVKRSLRFRAMRMFGRFEPVRAAVSIGAGKPRPVHSDIFRDANGAQIAADLKRDGIAFGLTLPPEVVAEIKEWALATPAFGNFDKSCGYHHDKRAEAEAKAGRRFTVGHYFNTSECPAIRRLAADPLIAELARAYIGSRAKFISTHMWWSYATDVDESERHRYAQQFHFDLDDYRFIKFFFYLTDVDLESGPHAYMRGTHSTKPMKDLFPIRRFSDEEVHGQWGADREIRVVGKAGTGFIADTFGIHKGVPPVKRDRLLIEFEWGRHYYGFGNDEALPAELKLL